MASTRPATAPTSYAPRATEIRVLKVIDASALAAVLFAESASDEISARLQDATLLAPALIDSELAHVCLKKLRRKSIGLIDIQAIFAARRTIEIDCRIVDTETVFDLALAAGLSGYDASYLLIARQFEAELVTLDKKLESAFLSAIGR